MQLDEIRQCKDCYHHSNAKPKNWFCQPCVSPVLRIKSSFKNLKLLTVENINRYQMLLFMFCFHHNFLPNAISHVIALGIQTNSQIHSHYTRASHHYYRSQFAIEIINNGWWLVCSAANRDVRDSNPDKGRNLLREFCFTQCP